MPNVNFSFQGWVNGADISYVTVTETGNPLDVSDLDATEVAAKLSSGEYMISLGDYLYERSREAEIEITDFEADHG